MGSKKHVEKGSTVERDGDIMVRKSTSVVKGEEIMNQDH